MNGLELIAHLRKRDPGIHAVLVTAQDSDSLRSLLQHEGIGYIRKPIEFDRLLHQVGSLLAEGREQIEESFHGSRGPMN
jgi:DNA-binding NtrC family response regulator